MEIDHLPHHIDVTIKINPVRSVKISAPATKSNIMKTLKNYLALILMAIAFSPLQAFTVNGKVVDRETNEPLPYVNISVKGHNIGTRSDIDGKFTIILPGENETLRFSFIGYQTLEVPVKGRKSLTVKMQPSAVELSEVILMEEDAVYQPSPSKSARMQSMSRVMYEPGYIDYNTEEYDVIRESGFLDAEIEPLSTFSIDVDAASYSNVRRVISYGSLPQRDMVRIEELINYFHYDYPDPIGEHPFSIVTEVSTAPWNPEHKLVHIGIQGKKIDYDELNPSNLVFLIDVSGSMSSAQKLPLVKKSLRLLVNELKPDDRIAIVVYAGAAGVVLPSTPVSQKNTILAALDNLTSGGSTAGGAGIRLAYKIAGQNFIEGGNNRVILATDGDFNVGESSTAAMVELIEKNRDKGIFLTITGFGMGNYKDGRMEQISNAGNGNYYYIDNIREAEKVFVTEMRATLFTIAKDVKIQVEFNPAVVQSYRLIGYENRAMENRDFNDDKKDAGELGAGHSVTALYEIIPVGVKSSFTPDIDPLKYQNRQPVRTGSTGELLTVKFRYKKPDGEKSIKIERVVANRTIPLAKTSDNFRFSAAVAEFGMLLRNSEYKGDSNYNSVIELASNATGKDSEGYRAEFIRMVKSSMLLSSNE